MKYYIYYMKLLRYNNYINEDWKNWLIGFNMLLGMGVVPPNIAKADLDTKKEWYDENKNNVDIEKFTPNTVVDLADILNDNSELILDSLIKNLETETSSELMVLTIPQLGNNYIEDYANTQFRRIGIGKKGSDNGVLFVMSVLDRKMRIEVGYGLESYLTDIECRQILDNAKPLFKQGKMEEGINLIVNSIIKEINVSKIEYKDTNTIQTTQSDNDIFLWFLGILIISGIGVLINYKKQSIKKELEELENIKRIILDIKLYKTRIENLKPLSIQAKNIKTELLNLYDSINITDDIKQINPNELLQYKMSLQKAILKYEDYNSKDKYKLNNIRTFMLYLSLWDDEMATGLGLDTPDFEGFKKMGKRLSDLSVKNFDEFSFEYFKVSDTIGKYLYNIEKITSTRDKLNKIKVDELYTLYGKIISSVDKIQFKVKIDNFAKKFKKYKIKDIAGLYYEYTTLYNEILNKTKPSYSSSRSYRSSSSSDTYSSSSSDSWSSSSSSSSWSFGGGDSGGGGSSSDW